RRSVVIATRGEAVAGHRLWTDALFIREALNTAPLAHALINELQLRSDLLPPFARHTATNGEDAYIFLRPYTLGVVLQIQKWIVGKGGLPSQPTPTVGEGKV